VHLCVRLVAKIEVQSSRQLSPRLALCQTGSDCAVAEAKAGAPRPPMTKRIIGSPTPGLSAAKVGCPLHGNRAAATIGARSVILPLAGLVQQDCDRDQGIDDQRQVSRRLDVHLGVYGVKHR
jgi:hypothetical protein